VPPKLKNRKRGEHQPGAGRFKSSMASHENEHSPISSNSSSLVSAEKGGIPVAQEQKNQV